MLLVSAHTVLDSNLTANLGDQRWIPCYVLVLSSKNVPINVVQTTVSYTIWY